MKVTRRQLNQIIAESLGIDYNLTEKKRKGVIKSVMDWRNKKADEKELDAAIAADEEAKKDKEKAEAESKKINAELVEDEDFDLTPFVGKTYLAKSKATAYNVEAKDKLVILVRGLSSLFEPSLGAKWKEKLQMMRYVTNPDSGYTVYNSSDEAYKEIMDASAQQNAPDEETPEEAEPTYEEGKEYRYEEGSKYTYIIKDGKWFTRNSKSKNITGLAKYPTALKSINDKFIKDGVITTALPGGDKDYQKKHDSVEDFMGKENIAESLSRGSLYRQRYGRRRY